MTSPSKDTVRVEHTPMPWVGERVGPKVAIKAADGTRAAGMVDPEVAERILRAVNRDHHFDVLVKALTELLAHVSDAHMSEADIARYHNAIFAKSVSFARATLSRIKTEG